MIRLILKGGLGNQMFQYAAAKSLAIENNTDLCLDLSYLKTRPPIKGWTTRDYELNLFNISDKTRSLFKIDILDKYLSYILLLAYNKFINQNYYAEGPNYYAFEPRFFKASPNATIEGYFNNYKYFQKYESEIKRIFDLNKFYDPKYDEIESKIMNCSSVSINIRRGDYLNSKNNKVFTYLGEDYYNKAISIIKDKIGNPHFFVFSYDDPKWFEDTFKLNPSEYTMMGKDYVGDRFKAYLRLISLCKHNIISNSTFAWWGAYLNKDPDKIVISPKKWMYKYDFDVPTDWITIDNK